MHRLPKNVLNAEIKVIQDLGVKIYQYQNWQRHSLRQTEKLDFDAVFIGCGTLRSNKLNIPGEDMQGVIHGVDYLMQISLGKQLFLGDRVAVVGGGNVYMDAVRTAVRTGSRKMYVYLYRRTRAEMPASPKEIEEAIEGIRGRNSSLPETGCGQGWKSHRHRMYEDGTG